MTAETCSACGVARPADARWCGHCGANLQRRPARSRGTTRRRAGGDPALVGGGGPVLLVDDEPPAGEEVTAAGRTWSPRARAAAAVGVLLVLAGALLLRPEPEPVYDPRGFTARGEATRSGVVSLAPLEVPRAVAWTAEVGAALATPAVRSAGDLVLERTPGGILVAREAVTGAVRWLRRDLRVGGDTVRVDDTVVASEGDRVRGFAAADGTERWTLPTPGDAVGVGRSDHGVLLASGGRNLLTSVDAATGEIRWTLAGDERLGGSIRRVVVGGAGVGLWWTTPPGLALDSPRVTHHVGLLDADSGAVTFRTALDRPFTASPVAVGDRAVATASSEGVVIRGLDGAPARRVDVGVPLELAATGDVVAVRTAGDGVVGIDLRTGQQRWHRPDLAGELTAVDGLVLTATGTVVDATSGRTLTTARRLDPRSVAGEADLRTLPAVAGRELELLDPAGDRRGSVPLVLDEAAAPAVGAGRVFVPTRDGVRAHVVADGTLDWSYAQLETAAVPGWGRPTARTPAVAASTVLVTPGTDAGEGPGLVALELTGGVRTWDRDDDRPRVRGPLTLAGEVAFVPVGREVHAYDVVTGRRAFAAVADAELGVLVLSPNRVIGGPDRPRRGDRRDGSDGEAVAILRRDRSVFGLAALARGSGPARAGERVVWGTVTGITALEELTGEPAWEVATPRPVCLDPVVAGGRVVVVQDPATLRAVADADGSPAWETRLAAPATASPVLAGGQVLVPLLDGTLRGYRLEDGLEAWQVELGGIADASPAVLDDRVLVHLRDGRLVALRP